MNIRNELKKDGDFKAIPNYNLNDIGMISIENIPTYRGGKLNLYKHALIKASTKQFYIKIYYDRHNELLRVFVDNLTDNKQAVTYLYMHLKNSYIIADLLINIDNYIKAQQQAMCFNNKADRLGIDLYHGSNKSY